MPEELEAVHVHRIDARMTIEEYSLKGYELVERTKPTIPAQHGFVKLIFRKVKTNGAESQETSKP